MMLHEAELRKQKELKQRMQDMYGSSMDTYDLALTGGTMAQGQQALQNAGTSGGQLMPGLTGVQSLGHAQPGLTGAQSMPALPSTNQAILDCLEQLVQWEPVHRSPVC